MSYSDLIIRDNIFSCDFDLMDQEVMERAKNNSIPERFVLEFKLGGEIYSYGMLSYHEISLSLLNELNFINKRFSHHVYMAGYPFLKASFDNDVIRFYRQDDGVDIGSMDVDLYFGRIVDILSRFENLRFFMENYKA